MTKYLAFDLEIAKEVPKDEDWKQFRPLGITCAAAVSSDGQQWLWHGKRPNGSIAPQMREDEIQHYIINTLLSLAAEGYTILTWNGLGFDFDILAEESNSPVKCKQLALDYHIDMMFHFFCSKGYPLGLDTAAKGMGLPGKPEGMDGAKAPQLWPSDPLRVMHYCMEDAKNTLDVVLAVESRGELKWTSRNGNSMSWPCQKWATVREAMTFPKPNTSWISDPWPREKFYGWLDEVTSPQPSLPHFDITGLTQWDPDEGNWALSE